MGWRSMPGVCHQSRHKHSRKKKTLPQMFFHTNLWQSDILTACDVYVVGLNTPRFHAEILYEIYKLGIILIRCMFDQEWSLDN